MKNLGFLITLALMVISSVSIHAQKFGYVNTQDLVQAIPEVKEANANIETFRTQLQKRGQEMLKTLQKKYADLQQKQERGEIAPLELEQQGKKLKEEEQQLMTFEQESQQKIVSKSETLLKPLREKIQNAIDAVASENGFDYIFDYSTGFVLYADQSTDVSSLVKAKLSM